MSDSLQDLKTDEKRSSKNKKDTSCFNTSACSYGVLAFLYLVISSDVFADVVLSALPGAVEGRSVTTLGAIMSAIILILAHLLIITYL